MEDNNKQVLEELLIQNIETDESLPDLEGAVSVEWQPMMHKDQIVINYDVKDPRVYYITNRYGNPLNKYIKDNGELMYFESKEFVTDLIKISIYISLLILAVVVLVRQKIKT